MIRGSIAAIVTPMNASGELDDEGLARLVDFHLRQGTHGLLVAGTTGESATLDFHEHIGLIRRVVERVQGEIPVIAGTGSNSLQEAIELSAAARQVGAKACLSVHAPWPRSPATILPRSDTMKTLLCLLTLLACSSVHAQQVLRFLSWQDYFDPEVIEDFQRSTGVRVEYHGFTTAEELMQAMQSSTAYDVIVPSHFMLKELVEANRLAPLDTSRLAHYKQFDPWLLSILAGQPAANGHVVPYLWGSVGMVVNAKMAQAAYGAPLPSSWSLLFEPQQVSRLFGCGVGLIDAPQEVASLILNYKGRNPTVSSPRQIAKALQPLEPLMPKFAELNNWAYIEALAQSKLCLAMSWSGHALRAIERNPALSYVIPDEGAAMYIDTLAIPANAPNPELAYHFIDFLIAPQNAIRNARATHFYPPLPSDSPSMRQFAAEYPLQVMSSKQRRASYLLESLSGAQQAALESTWQKLRATRQ